MTHEQAAAKAARVARRNGKFVAVIFEAGEYDYATENDLGMFWQGAQIVAEFGPDGQFLQPRH